MTQFSDLQQLVLNNGFADSKYRPSVKTWLNAAQRDIARRVNVRTEEASQTYATVSGTVAYALPTNFARLIDFTNTDDQDPIYSIDLRDYDDAPTSSGKPTSYVVIAGNLTLYPTPNAVYNLRLRYWKLPADMVSDTDSPELAADFEQVMQSYAISRCYQREADVEMAQYWRNEYEVELARIRGQSQYDTHDGPTQVPGTWGGMSSSLPSYTLP